MNIPTIKIYKRDDLKKDGSNSLYLRLTINRVVKYFTLGISVKMDAWDSKRFIVKKSDSDYVYKNKVILNNLNKANKIVQESILFEKDLTFEVFQKQYKGDIRLKDIDFYTFADEYFNSEAAKKLKINSLRHYKAQASKLKIFKKNLLFSNIDSNFIHSYEAYMYSELKNKKNTVHKSLTWIKSIINIAISENIIKENPFAKIKIKKEAGKRVSLTLNEIDRLENIFNTTNLSDSQNNVLRYFLFSCYTGLRFGDILALRKYDIKKIDEKEYIQIDMQKTGEFVSVPLSERARTLIIKSVNIQFKLFKVISGQKTNEYLKEIMKIAKIDKSISFHCARHTFATVGFNRLKIPIEVISKILGHTDIKTTMVYTKIDNEKLREETLKWDKV